MFGFREFREVREVKREERGLAKKSTFDPDKRIDVDQIVAQAQAAADQAWDDFADKHQDQFDPDRRIEIS